jgi:hypothetical protein
MGEAIKEPTIRTGPERTLGTFEAIPIEEQISSVVINLPSIDDLRRMKEKPMIFVINDEEWELSVNDTESINSPRKRNMKEIVFTRVTLDKDGSRMRRGIVTDNNLKFVFGAIIGDASIGVLSKPDTLDHIMQELKTELPKKQSLPPFPKNNN